MSISTIIIFFIILLVLVLVHEAGHFFAAKLSKMRVDEFAFGFPPKIFGIHKNGTDYNFNLLPLGGYVKIHGENGVDEVTEDKDKTFSSRPKWQQIFVLAAGVMMNLFLAWILLSISFTLGTKMAQGSFVNDTYLTNVKTLVSSVAPHSPAEIAGIKPLDEVTQIETASEVLPNPSSDEIPHFVSQHQNETIKVTLLSGGQEKEVSLTPVYNKELDRNIIGISTGGVGEYRAPIFVALKDGAVATYEFTKLTVLGFKDLFKGLFSGHAKEAAAGLTGPVGIVSLVGGAQKEGLASLFAFAALISINLAVLNILPLPALDGGRVLFVIIESIIRRPLSKNFQLWVNGISFLALVSLMLFITYRDVIKLF